MSDNKLPTTIGGEEENDPNNIKKLNAEISTKQSTEKDNIRYLEEKQTNFVFLFGKSGVGKTAITASVLHYLSTNPKYYVEVNREENNLEGTSDVLQFRDAIRNKRFPGRTDLNISRNLDILFHPKNKTGERLPPVPLTFLEISGEDLHKVEVSKDGKLPESIDLYFKADGLSMLFILVTTPQDAQKDDTIMNEFLDYISSKDTKYRDAYVCLLISQFDRYKQLTNGLSIQSFMKSRMPNSYGRFYHQRNTFGYYSVGEVVEVSGEAGKPEYHIKKINQDSPHKLFDWIYTTITKKELNPTSLWQKIEKWFNI